MQVPPSRTRSLFPHAEIMDSLPEARWAYAPLSLIPRYIALLDEHIIASGWWLRQGGYTSNAQQ